MFVQWETHTVGSGAMPYDFRKLSSSCIGAKTSVWTADRWRHGVSRAFGLAIQLERNGCKGVCAIKGERRATHVGHQPYMSHPRDACSG